MPGTSRSSSERAADALGDVTDPSTADTLIGILKHLRDVGAGIIGGPVTLIDGADVAQGTILDAAVTGDNVGTISGKLRGLLKIVTNVWDAANSALKVNVVASTGGGLTDAELRAAAVPVSDATAAATLELIRAILAGEVDPVNVYATIAGTVPISAAALPLPAGASAEATLTQVRDRLPALLDADGGVKTHVQNLPATQPVSAAALPLPAGAATDAGLATLLAELQAKTEPADVQSVAVTNVIPVTGPLTDAQLRAAAVPVTAAQGASQADPSEAWPMSIVHTTAPFRTFDLELNRMRRAAETEGGELRRARMTRRNWLRGATASSNGVTSRRSSSRFEAA